MSNLQYFKNVSDQSISFTEMISISGVKPNQGQFWVVTNGTDQYPVFTNGNSEDIKLVTETGCDTSQTLSYEGTNVQLPNDNIIAWKIIDDCFSIWGSTSFNTSQIVPGVQLTQIIPSNPLPIGKGFKSIGMSFCSTGQWTACLISTVDSNVKKSLSGEIQIYHNGTEYELLFRDCYPDLDYSGTTYESSVRYIFMLDGIIENQ